MIVIIIAIIHKEDIIVPVIMAINYNKEQITALVSVLTKLFQCLFPLVITISDINECEQSTVDCNQLCHNLLGSFYCSCFQGYTLSTGDNSTCLGKK